MDEQLKRRLLGAGIISILAVVVVPFFFEDKAPRTATELPLPIEPQALSLPKDEVAVVEEKASPDAPSQPTVQASKKRAYTVVPLEEPSAKAPAQPVAAQDDAVKMAPVDEESEQTEAVSKAPVILDPKAPQSKTNLTPKLQRPLGDVPPARVAQDVQEPVKTAPKKPEALKPVKPATAPLAQDSVPKKAPATTDVAKKAPTPSVSAQNLDSTKKSPSSQANAKPAVPSSYLVQAGTFSDESNAKNLVDKLKKRSLPVRLQVVEGLNGKVYRVTVGPNLDRGRAEQIQKQLSEQDGVRGLILQSH